MGSIKHIAVITGASSGIGAEFARQLAARGCYVLLCGRNEERLRALRKEIDADKCDYFTADISDTRSCIDLYAAVREYHPDILINNAGFGVYGDFTESSLTKELSMIDVNIKAMHLLFKLFLKDFEKQGRGYILNTGSIAGFLPGPHMSSYYSSKAYVVRQTVAVHTELAMRKSPVHVSVLCPGPVTTDFNRNAGISSIFKGISPEECVFYTLRQMKHAPLFIIPTLYCKAIAAGSHLVPQRISSFAAYLMQKGKKQIEDDA